MSGLSTELVAGPIRAMRRAVFWWSAGLGSLVAVTVAFWPAFQGSSGISQAIDQLPAGVVSAFGLQDFATPAGFLRGNLYELFLPLLLTGAAVALVSSHTAGEEASGRLELVLAQPVHRRAVFLGRAVAALAALLVITVIVAVVQIAMDAVVGLQIDLGHLLATVTLCGLLAALHGSLALAVAGLRPRPSLVVGVGIGLALAGYVVAALLPLSTVLAPWRHLSPWDWAFGGDPLTGSTELWRYLVIAIPSVLLAAFALWSVTRRDIAAG